MQLETLEKTLRISSAIENFNKYPCKGETFERNLEFTIRDNKYKIEWYSNLCTLYINEFEMMFDHVYIESTWPRHYKNFLQFYNNKNEIVAVIPLEKYDK